MIVQRVIAGGICCGFLLGMLPSASLARQQSSARLVIDHKGFVRPQRRGSRLVISATITSPAGVRKAEVLCRAVGTREFTALPMVSRGENVYRAVVPDWMTIGEGLEYYITATDRLGRSASYGFVGFPLRVRLVSTRRPTRQDRLKALQDTLNLIRKSREAQDSEEYNDPTLGRNR